RRRGEAAARPAWARRKLGSEARSRQDLHTARARQRDRAGRWKKISRCTSSGSAGGRPPSVPALTSSIDAIVFIVASSNPFRFQLAYPFDPFRYQHAICISVCFRKRKLDQIYSSSIS